MRRLPWQLFALSLVALAFALGLGSLFRARFYAGDVYPAYSTLRADPRGASAFYESLERLEGIQVQQNFQRWEILHERTEHLQPRPTLYLLAASWYELGNDEVQRWAARGGRVILALPALEDIDFLMPPPSEPDHEEAEEEASENESEEGAESSSSLEEETALNHSENSRSTHWYWRTQPGASSSTRGFAQRTSQAPESLPGDLVWPGGWAFRFDHGLTSTGPEDALHLSSKPGSLKTHSTIAPSSPRAAQELGWTPLYTVNGRVVMVERQLGRGSIVVLGHPFPFSNEALLRHRETALLQWLQGDSPQAVFHERHHEIIQPEGFTHLLRDYGLEPFFGGLALLALLVFWRGGVGLLPPLCDEVTAPKPSRSGLSGYADLLRRTIAPTQLLETALQLWEQSQPVACSPQARQLRQLRVARARQLISQEQALPKKQRDYARAYAALSQALHARD